MKKIIPILLLLLLTVTASGPTSANTLVPGSSLQIELAENERHARLMEISTKNAKLFHDQKAEALRWADSLGLPVRLEFEDGRVSELMRLENGTPVYYTTYNAGGAQLINSDKVYPGGPAGFSLTGSGQTLGMWDGGKTRDTHQEFMTGGVSRVTQKDNATILSSHATHVAGTMMAAGVQSQAKGMSYEALLDAYDWNNDVSEMAAAAAAGLQVSQHSYGLITGWSYGTWAGPEAWHWFGNTSISETEDHNWGFYSNQAQSWDNIAHNAPNYLIVKAAGNDRGKGPAPGTFHYAINNQGNWVGSTTVRDLDGGDDGYKSISHAVNAKNVLSVGAVSSSGAMSDFSGWGPTDDGRVKPDIVAKGVSVYSSTADGNTTYATVNGTSMSGPMVSGSVGLLLEHQENLHPGLPMRAATIKALILHSADDMISGAPGPDYRFGWGLMNTMEAAEIMEQNAVSGGIHIHELTLNQGGEITIDVIAAGNEPLRASIVWTDPPGTPVHPPQLNPPDLMLVNDLDMRITHATSGTHYPYRLNPANPSAPATTGDNFRDNVEMIHLSNPLANESYTITINHKGSLSGGSQEFSLIISGNQAADLPVVSTTAPGNITYDSATSGGNVQEAGGSPVTARGVVWGTQPNPSIFSHTGITSDGSGTGTFTSLLTGLSPVTTYHVRAYATNSEGTGYGENLSFTTPNVDGLEAIISEDFSGTAPGNVPVGWTRTVNNWAVANSNHAGGIAAPELRFAWSPSVTGVHGAITPLIDASDYENIVLSFVHSVDDFSGDYVLRVQTSLDGQSWTDQWSLSLKSENEGLKREKTQGVLDVPSQEVEISLDNMEGESFYLAFVFDGNSFNINFWYVDDVVVSGVLTGEGPEEYSVTFTVEDTAGDPINNATITLGDQTNNPGDYLFTGLPPGTYSFSVVADGYHTETGSVQIINTSISHNVVMTSIDPETFTLTMLEPYGEGGVVPSAGQHIYPANTSVDLLANASPGWVFSHWTGGVEEPGSAATSIFMDTDKTVQAFFTELGEGLTLPWSEDFSGTAGGNIPDGWTRDAGNWGVSNTSHAGGSSPEMRFNWTPSISGEYYLTSPPINTSGHDALQFSFRNYVNNYSAPGPYTLRVLTMADGVEYLVEEWVDPDNIPAHLFEAILTADEHGVGSSNFHVAWVFDGLSLDINNWNFDDIFLEEAAEDETYTLTMLSPSGSGSVHPAAGTHDYPGGTVVDLVATPASGWEFSHWTGGVANAGNPTTTIVMNADKTVQAFFTEEQETHYTLTMLSPSGSGSVHPAAGTHDYPGGTVVDLVATPASGWEFSHWTGGVANAGNPTTTIVMDADKTVQAFFTEPGDALTLPWSENFTGTATGAIPDGWTRDVDNWGVSNTSQAGGSSPEMRFNWSPNVTGVYYLTSPAINTAGYDSLQLSFKNYVDNYGAPGSYVLRVLSIAGSEEHLVEEWVDPGNIPAHEFVVTLTADEHGVGDANLHIAWVFDGVSFDINNWNFDDIMLKEAVDPEVFTLSMLPPSGSGSVVPVPGDHDYQEATVVDLVATPASGWEFSHWTGGVANPNSQSTNILMDQDQTVRAFFAEAPSYVLTLSAEPSAGGTLAGGGSYAAGTMVQVTAAANTGFDFLHWKDIHGNTVSSQPGFSYSMPGQDMTLTAFFEYQTSVPETSLGEAVVYPNPAHDKLYIDLNGICPHQVKLMLLNMQGQIIKQLENMEGQKAVLDVEKVLPGIYMLRIECGGQSLIRKVVVH